MCWTHVKYKLNSGTLVQIRQVGGVDRVFSSVHPIEAWLQHGQTNGNTGVSGLAAAFGYMPTEFYFKFPQVHEITKQIGEFWNFMKAALFLNFKLLYLLHLYLRIIFGFLAAPSYPYILTSKFFHIHTSYFFRLHHTRLGWRKLSKFLFQN